MATAPQPGTDRYGNPKRTMFIGFLIVLGALYGFFSLYQESQTASDSGEWPTTTATIQRSAIRTTSTRRGRETWTVDVAYRYEVDGEPYEGELIRFGGFPSTSSFDEAQQVEARYAEGSSHPVSYDPSDPESAVLEPGAAAAGSSLGLGGALLLLVLVVGIIPIYQGSRRLKAKKAAGLA